MVVEQPHPVDAPLASCVVDLLLAALADADRHVRRAAVVSLSAVREQTNDTSFLPILCFIYFCNV